MESLARVESAAGRIILLTRFRENRWAELAEIYTTCSLGCFLLLISFPARSVTFDLLSKAKYTKMVLISCGRGSGKTGWRNWPKLIPRDLWAVFSSWLVFRRVPWPTTCSLGYFLGLISFLLCSVTFDLLSKVKYMILVGQNTWMSISGTNHCISIL